MKLSNQGIKDLIASEGSRLKAYQDQGGVWTIGVGHTSAAGAPKVVKGMTITKAEEEEILSRDIAKFEGYVNKLVKVPLNQNQFDALVELTYNIGSGALSGSTLLRKLNAGNYSGAAEQFLVWNKVSGKTNQGLVNRRAREKKKFETPVTVFGVDPVVVVEDSWFTKFLKALGFK